MDLGEGDRIVINKWIDRGGAGMKGSNGEGEGRGYEERECR